MASIVVVGGGVAGLTCAWRLQRAGHDVEVLEREPEPGGRMRSQAHGEFVLDRGVRCVAGGDLNLHAVAGALGIGGRVRPLARSSSGVLREGQLHAGDCWSPLRLLTSPLLSPRARARLVRLPVEALRSWRRPDPLRRERGAAVDGETLVAGARRTVGEENLEYLLAPTFSFAFGSDPEEISWAFVLLALRFPAGGRRLQSFSGGNGLLTRTLAERVPVRLGCDVSSIETETEGARVRYQTRGREGTVIADAAVVAMPGSEVARLCPKLTPAERGFFEGVRYERGITAHLLLETAPRAVPHYAVTFPRVEGLDLYGLVLEHHKIGAAPPGAGLLGAALTSGASARLWKAPDGAVADLVVENLARTPIGRLAPAECVVNRWSRMSPRFEPGHLSRVARFLNRMDRSPRIAFAGDYLLGPSAEGAVTSGARAATEVVRSIEQSD